MKRISAGTLLLLCFLSAAATTAEALPAPRTPYRSFTLQETRQLAQAGFTDEDANVWLDALLRRDVFEKQPQLGRLAAVNFLIEWKKTGFSSDIASAWDRVLASGIYWNEHPKTVKKLVAAGVTPEDLSALEKRQLRKIGKTLNEVYALQGKGTALPPHVKLEALAAWTTAGFKPDEAELFLENGKPPMDLPAAKAWKEAGLSAKETLDYYAVTKSTDAALAAGIKALGISPAEASEGYKVIEIARANAKASPGIDPAREYTFKTCCIYASDKTGLQEFLQDLAKDDAEARLRLLGSLHKGTVSYLKEPLKVKLVGRTAQLIQLQDTISGHTIWTMPRSIE